MILAVKIRLLPTKEQEILFWKSSGTARWSYNYFLSENNKLYQIYLETNKQGQRYVSNYEIRKRITILKKTEYTWLNEVGSNVVKMAVIEADKAFSEFLQGKKGRPHYKSRHKSKISFYVNYESLKRTPNGFQGEKLGNVKTAQPLSKIKKGSHYVNPRISFDGKHWYLSVGIEVNPKQEKLTDVKLGIDLGIKTLATVSDGQAFPNINKTKRVRLLKKRLRREQRKVSRRIERNIQSYSISKVIGRDGKEHIARRPVYMKSLRECKNIERQNRKIRLIYKRVKDIRINYIHQITTYLVKTKPSRIVMEDLNVRGMMKNRYLSKAIQEQCFYEFRRQMKYKCELYGIEFITVDRYYPSSKLCSNCGNKKTDLKLSDRIYHCSNCGLIMDRDLNASINLANY